MRIAVMGYVGSGKTYLSKSISHMRDIPVMHLDEIYFDKNWRPIEKSVVLSQVSDFMINNHWLIDGFYSDLLMDERLEKADMIILMLLPRATCFFRAIKRSKSRAQEGYKNDLNPWFLKFTLFGCRNRKRRRAYAQIAQRYKDKTVILRSSRQVKKFIDSFQ